MTITQHLRAATLPDILIVTSAKRPLWRDFAVAAPLTEVTYWYVHNQDGSVSMTSEEDLAPLAGSLVGLLHRMDGVNSFILKHRRLSVEVRRMQIWEDTTDEIVRTLCCVRGWDPGNVNVRLIPTTALREEPHLARFIANAA